MAGGKETPRQKMIGMMYLVLLALLAMNVTKSVLNSFVVINGAMTETNEAFDEKNEATFSEFEKQKSINEAKVLPWYKKAQAVREASKELDDYFANLKIQIIAKTEGLSEEEMAGDLSWVTLDTAEALGNIDTPQHILLGSDETKPVDGAWTMLEMKRKIAEWEEKVLAQFPPNQRESLNIGFKFEGGYNNDGELEPWEITHFYHAPLAAVITDISMFQNQVKNSEYTALNMLMSNISAEDFKFDEIAVKIIPNSNYVVLGDSFKADVIVAAYSTTQAPVLEVGTGLDTAGKGMNDWKVTNMVDESRIKYDNGVAKYGYKPTTEGEVTWGGIIKLKKPGTNQFELYPFEHTFIAAKPSMVVSPTKMNVMYKGLKNPVDVSVAGFSASELVVTVSGGALSGSNGSYFVQPSRESRLVKVNVAVKTKSGATKPMGTAEFRVKSIPKPTPKFATVEGSGRVSLAQVKASRDVTVELKDFMFDGLKYTVTKFDMTAYVKGKKITLTSKGSGIDSQMRTLIGNQRSKDEITIKNIRVNGPNGNELIPGNVVVEIK